MLHCAVQSHSPPPKKLPFPLGITLPPFILKNTGTTGHFKNTGIYRTGQKIPEIQDTLGAPTDGPGDKTCTNTHLRSTTNSNVANNIINKQQWPYTFFKASCIKNDAKDMQTIKWPYPAWYAITILLQLLEINYHKPKHNNPAMFTPEYCNNVMTSVTVRPYLDNKAGI